MADKFRGFTYAPSYEDEVIMLFGMMLPHFKDVFEIEEYTDEFPDCSAKVNGELVGIEFEVKASNFKSHEHYLDPHLANCNYLICWKNDTGQDTLRFKKKENGENVEIMIIALSEEIEALEKKGLRFILNPEKQKRPIARWERETFFRQLKENVENGKIKNDESNFIREFFSFCENNKGLELVYGVGKIASLTVRVKKWDKISPSGAMADGHVWINFVDANKSWVYPSPEIEAEVRRRFNQPPTGYYKYLKKDKENLSKLEETLNWLVERSSSPSHQL